MSQHYPDLLTAAWARGEAHGEARGEARARLQLAEECLSTRFPHEEWSAADLDSACAVPLRELYALGTPAAVRARIRPGS